MEFLIAFVLMLLVIGGMALGVVFGRSPIKGSCGGLGNIPGASQCVCSKPCEKKIKRMAEEARKRRDQETLAV